MKILFSGLVIVMALGTVSTSHESDPAIINSVTESLGNVQTNFSGTREGGGWPTGFTTPTTVTVGDQITFTVNATDPDNDLLQYQFAIQPPGDIFEAKYDWSTSNIWTRPVDPSEFGPDVTVFIAVKNDGGNDYIVSFGGDGLYIFDLQC